MIPLGVLETALYADDLHRAEVFYSTVLDLELDSKAVDPITGGISTRLLVSFRVSLR